MRGHHLPAVYVIDTTSVFTICYIHYFTFFNFKTFSFRSAVYGVEPLFPSYMRGVPSVTLKLLTSSSALPGCTVRIVKLSYMRQENCGFILTTHQKKKKDRVSTAFRPLKPHFKTLMSSRIFPSFSPFFLRRSTSAHSLLDSSLRSVQ